MAEIDSAAGLQMSCQTQSLGLCMIATAWKACAATRQLPRAKAMPAEPGTSSSPSRNRTSAPRPEQPPPAAVARLQSLQPRLSACSQPGQGRCVPAACLAATSALRLTAPSLLTATGQEQQRLVAASWE